MKKDNMGVVIGGLLIWCSNVLYHLLENQLLRFTAASGLFAFGLILITIGSTEFISKQQHSDADRILEIYNTQNEQVLMAATKLSDTLNNLLSSLDGINANMIDIKKSADMATRSIDDNANNILNNINNISSQYNDRISHLNNTLKEESGAICSQYKVTSETIINQQSKIITNTNDTLQTIYKFVCDKYNERSTRIDELIKLQTETRNNCKNNHDSLIDDLNKGFKSNNEIILSLRNEINDDAASLYRKISEVSEILKNNEKNNELQDICDNIIDMQSTLHKMAKEFENSMEDIGDAQNDALKQSQLQCKMMEETYRQQIDTIVDKIAEYEKTAQQVLEQYITISKEDNSRIDAILRRGK